MPVRSSTQCSKPVTSAAKLVGCSAALSGGRTQLGLVVPASVLHSGVRQTSCCWRRGSPAGCCASGRYRGTAPSRWKIWLIRSSARASSALPCARHRHAPRHLGEAELLEIAGVEVVVGEVLGEEAVVLGGQRAGLVLQPVGQHARLVEQHQARALRHQLGVGAVADGDADRAARQVEHAGHRQLARADHGRLRPVVVRADEAHLAVALGVVAHGGDGEIDAVLGQQRNAGGGIDAHEVDVDAQHAADRQRHVDLVALALVAGRGWRTADSSRACRRGSSWRTGS